VNPLDLFDREGVEILLQAVDPYRRMQNWQQRAAREQIEQLGRALSGIRSSLDTPAGSKPYSTQELIGDILAMPGAPEGNRPVVLRDVLLPASFTQEEEQDDTTEEERERPVGNVQFLFMLAQPTGKDDDPSDPRNFRARIEQLNEASADLRIDLNEWDAAQQKLPPSERKNPPCVTLSTIHSVKGAQWPNVTVVMAPGVFPHRATDAGALVSEDETNPALREARLDFLTERQLAYVAFTRAGEDLTVLSPHTNLNGQAGPTPRFVTEAGLQTGQNVPGKNDPSVPEAESVRTILAWSHFSDGAPEYDEPENVTYNRSWS
jgi:superfamily I DNA/RNA helicase